MINKITYLDTFIINNKIKIIITHLNGDVEEEWEYAMFLFEYTLHGIKIEI